MLDRQAIDALFLNARSQNGWLPHAVSDAQLRALYELARCGPTSGNSCPMRVIFVRTEQGRNKLCQWVSPGNVHKVMSAPVTAIIGHDHAFHRALPRLFPHNPGFAKSFEGIDNEAHAATTAFRNGSLQAAYLMFAARALGLDCGPMSGFDAAGVDLAFWDGTAVKTNFLCSLGYGDSSKLFDRLPRLEFEEVCQLQ